MTDKEKKERTKMLTVRKLIDYLKTQNPDACVVAFEMNSNAYIEQFPDLPNRSICTIREDRERERDFMLNQWFKGYDDKVERTDKELAEIYRYCDDDDVVIRF